MSKIQERFPELWEKLHPPGRFEQYLRKREELMNPAFPLTPEERRKEMAELMKTREAADYLKFQTAVARDYFPIPEKMAELDVFLKLWKEENMAFPPIVHSPPPSTEKAAAPAPFYARQIAGYVLQTIGLYRDALTPSALRAIRLRFDTSVAADDHGIYRGEEQPILYLTFDTGERRVCIGELWNESLPLEREGRKNAQIWAESVWPEFRECASAEDVAKAAEQARDIVAKEFPGIPVDCEIVP